MRISYGSITALMLVLFVSNLDAQGLVLTTRGAANANSMALEGNDLLFWNPTVQAPLVPWYGRRSLDVISGDRNSDGIYNDAPAVVDALSAFAVSPSGEAIGSLLSFAANFTSLDGTSIKDGDIVSFQGGGVVNVVYPETFFAQITSTTSIDVDAFHLAANGDLYFSFAQDEATSDPVLISQNNGEPSLDETTVFRLNASGVLEIFFDRSAILAFVNQAIGASLTTVVDLTAFTADPEHPGEFWFALGSSNNSIEGSVFSTFMGGTLAQFGGVDLASASFGFDDLEILEGLAWIGDARPPLALLHPEDQSAPVGMATFQVRGALPFSTVQMALSLSQFPSEPVEFFTEFPGRGYVHLDIHQILLQSSLTDPAFALMTNGVGDGQKTFSLSGVPVGLHLTFQAFDTASFELAPPIAVVTSP